MAPDCFPQTTHPAPIAPRRPVVMVSFVQPDCTYKKGSYSLSGTGLQFSSDGPTVRDAIKALKAARPNTRVIVAVGGATYTNFKGMNTQCIKDLVDDFGFDGADLDWGERPGVGGGAAGAHSACAVTGAVHTGAALGSCLNLHQRWLVN